jgi:outer membrane protein
MRVLLATALCLAAGASHALDLVTAYERALRHDPSTLAADQAAAAGREKAVQGDARVLPQVSFSAGVTHVDDRSSSSVPPALSGVFKPESSGEVRQAAVQLKQPLYDAKATAEREQLHQQSDLAETRHAGARQDLMQRVAEAYLNVLLAQEHLRVVRAEKAAVGMQRDRAQARFEVGRGRITDLQETQARYDGVLTREVSAQSTLALREAQFGELTGAPAQGLAPLRAGFAPSPPQPDDLRAWQARGEDHSTRVRTRQGELAIAAAETGKYRLAGRPSLDLVASYGYKGQDGGLSPLIAADSDRNATIGVQLTIPLFAGGAIDSRERESIAKQREAEQELAAARRDARLQVQDAYLAVKTGVARVGSLEQQLRSAGTALEATTLGRDVGTRTELDVLDAQQRVFSAQLELAQARTDYLLGRVRLAAAAGELRPDDLRALNGYLAP